MRFTLQPIYPIMYICTSRIASLQPSCNNQNFVCLFLCQATNSFPSEELLADTTFQHEASFPLPCTAVIGTSADDKKCSRIFLLCTPFWRTWSGTEAVYRSVRDYVIQTHTLSQRILVLKGTKRQLSVYDKMPMLYVL